MLYQANNNLTSPAITAKTPNSIDIGKINCTGLVNRKYSMNGCDSGCKNTCSGAVNTPKNGITAPILITSVKELITINIISKNSFLFRL